MAYFWHCSTAGGPAPNPMAKSGPTAAASLSSPSQQSQWLISRHGSIDVVPTAIGLGATDQTWHHEQWLHLKFAGRKCRHDVPPVPAAQNRCSAGASQSQGRSPLVFFPCSCLRLMDRTTQSASPHARRVPPFSGMLVASWLRRFITRCTDCLQHHHLKKKKFPTP